MTVEQLGNLAKNRFPTNPEYSGKSDRDIGLLLMRKHRAYRGRQKVPADRVAEPVIEKKKIDMPTGYRPEGVEQYASPIGPKPAPKPEPKPEVGATGVAPIDIGVGINKGIASSFFGMASLPHAAGKWLAEKITGKPAPDVFQKTIRQKIEETGSLEAKGKWEKLGKGGEQLAEFFAPTPVGKTKIVSKGLDIINKLKKPASVTKIISKPIVTRATQQAAKFGGVVAVQEGEFGKEAQQAALIGAVVPFASKGVNSVLTGFNNVRKITQEKIWISVLGRTKDDIIANPISAEVAKQGVFAWTTKGIGTAFKKEIDKSKPIIEEALATKHSAIKVASLKKAVTDAAVKELRANATKIDPLIKDHKLLTRAGVEVIVNRYIKPGQTSISRKNALQVALSVLREIEENVLAKDVKAISLTKHFADVLLKRTVKVLPEMKDDIHKIAILSEAMPAMKQSIATGKSAASITSQDWLVGLAGEFSGVGGLKVFIGKKLMESTAVKTGVSSVLSKFDKLPTEDAKIAFYLGIKGIFAMTVDKFIKSD